MSKEGISTVKEKYNQFMADFEWVLDFLIGLKSNTIPNEGLIADTEKSAANIISRLINDVSNGPDKNWFKEWYANSDNKDKIKLWSSSGFSDDFNSVLKRLQTFCETGITDPNPLSTSVAKLPITSNEIIDSVTEALKLAELIDKASTVDELINVIEEHPGKIWSTKGLIDKDKLLAQMREVSRTEKALTTPNYITSNYNLRGKLISLIRARRSRFDLDRDYFYRMLNSAAEKNDTRLLSTLFENQYNVNFYDITLIQAVKSKNFMRIITALLDAGANVDATDKYGRTPLHWTALNFSTNIVHFTKNSSRDIFNILLQKKASLNVIDKDGATPLHLAIQNGDITIVKALIVAGAKIDIADRNGNTPLDIAKHKNNHELIKILSTPKEQLPSSSSFTEPEIRSFYTPYAEQPKRSGSSEHEIHSNPDSTFSYPAKKEKDPMNKKP